MLEKRETELPLPIIEPLCMHSEIWKYYALFHTAKMRRGAVMISEVTGLHLSKSWYKKRSATWKLEEHSKAILTQFVFRGI